MNEAVNIKEKYKSLDRNDFEQVEALVSQIIEDIKGIMKIDHNMGMKLVEDYLFDLINPDLLDLDSQ